MNRKKHYVVPDVELLEMISYADVLASSGTPYGDGNSEGLDNTFNLSDLIGGDN